jgi:hypothetical protein
LFAACLTTAPWPTLFVIGLLYLGTIPLTVRAAAGYRRAAENRKAAETVTTTPALLTPPPPATVGETAVPPNEWRH